ncbi:MAG: GNAT family N-acetyltransferase [Spirochaetaceae bacterium]|nr:GNAT family N-acetyltransferase [Spirochaetaceae bacterium]
MLFELTKEIVEQIMFAMENQDENFLFDSKDCKLVESFLVDSDDNRYYCLPEWNSTKGFQLMEQFVSVQRNPTVKQELRSILVSGKGVFRNFKNVLKLYPEAEKNWFAFREKEMTRHIMQWYNVLRDAWGLEKLGEEPEENDDLVHGDFVFRNLCNEEAKEKLSLATSAHMAELKLNFPEELGVALEKLWQMQHNFPLSELLFSCVAETVDEDFAGCISASYCLPSTNRTVILTTFFVFNSYRGLGIGKELLSKCLFNLKNLGVRWVILSDMIVPDFLIPCLSRLGFTNFGGGYIADLIAE